MKSWYKIAKEDWKKLLREKDGLSIYIIDGNYVRNNFEVDFALAGHHYRWDFIPDNEIWVENTNSKFDIECAITHEITERKDMKDNGTDYEDAHLRALKIEEEKRKENKEK
jgi:hypothetical protein